MHAACAATGGMPEMVPQDRGSSSSGVSTDVLEVSRRLRGLFDSAVVVGDVAGTLASFDGVLPASAALAILEQQGLEFAGVRDGGVVNGYLRRGDLSKGGTCGQLSTPFEPDDVIAQEASLDVALLRLERQSRLFVTAFGSVAGVLTWSDVQKPPARMWLFGLVTVVELAFTGLVDSFFPENSWREAVSEGRLRKAEELRSQRRRAGATGVRLVDCLQLSDKGQILLSHVDTRRLMGAASRREGERRLRRLVQLRDNLAHSQDIVSGDWDVIVGLARTLDGVLGIGSAFGSQAFASDPHPRRER